MLQRFGTTKEIGDYLSYSERNVRNVSKGKSENLVILSTLLNSYVSKSSKEPIINPALLFNIDEDEHGNMSISLNTENILNDRPLNKKIGNLNEQLIRFLESSICQYLTITNLYHSKVKQLSCITLNIITELVSFSNPEKSINEFLNEEIFYDLLNQYKEFICDYEIFNDIINKNVEFSKKALEHEMFEISQNDSI